MRGHNRNTIWYAANNGTDRKRQRYGRSVEATLIVPSFLRSARLYVQFSVAIKVGNASHTSPTQTRCGSPALCWRKLFDRIGRELEACSGLERVLRAAGKNAVFNSHARYLSSSA